MMFRSVTTFCTVRQKVTYCRREEEKRFSGPSRHLTVIVGVLVMQPIVQDTNDDQILPMDIS
jgi:hypothetical protein